MKNKPLKKKEEKKEKHIVIHDLCMQMIQSFFVFFFTFPVFFCDMLFVV